MRISRSGLNLNIARKKVARRYINRRPHQFRVGDTVLYLLNLVSYKAQDISAKPLLRWSEPRSLLKYLSLMWCY